MSDEFYSELFFFIFFLLFYDIIRVIFFRVSNTPYKDDPGSSVTSEFVLF